MNFADVIVLALVALAVFFCVRSVRRNFKSGSGCMGCPNAGSCHRSGGADSCACGGLRPEDIHIKRVKGS